MYDEVIKEANQASRSANMDAMKQTGWKRGILLWFANFFAWLSDQAQEGRREEQRGKGDNYHDEY